MKKLQTKLFLALLFLAFSVPLLAQTDEQTQKEIRAVEQSLLPALVSEGQDLPFYTLEERMKYYHVPGVSIAVLKDGKLHWAKAYGIANSESGSKVDENTLFQAGSISKPVAALAALKLVEEGKIDLDTDVNTYLKSWKVPENKFTKTEKVTLRRLLTHTAGLTVHGFPGYKPSDDFPTNIQVLNGKGNTSKIVVDTEPGKNWRYSGGGYTIMEQMVEDITGKEFGVFMDQEILPKVGMSKSTYSQPLKSKYEKKASAAYDSEGKLIKGVWHNYPEQAAAGLWTTPKDLANYFIEIQKIYAGKKGGLLSPDMVKEMLSKDKNNWGLGPMLRNSGDSLLFGHGGKNAGFSNNMMATAKPGYGLIVMTNADRGTRLMSEIIRAISKVYDWNISHPKTLKTISPSRDKLESYLGKYQLTEDEDYVVEVILKEQELLIVDDNSKDVHMLLATSELEFWDRDSGDRVVFEINKEKSRIVFVWNGQYRFTKM